MICRFKTSILKSLFVIGFSIVIASCGSKEDDCRYYKEQFVLNMLEQKDPATEDIVYTKEFLLAFYVDTTTAADYAFYIQKYASKYRIPISLIIGLITRESRWNYKATGIRVRLPGTQRLDRAQGLMQVMPSIWKNHPSIEGCPSTDLYDPETNICYGVQVLRQCLDRHPEKIKLALGCYSGNAREYYNYVFEHIGEFYFHRYLGQGIF